LEFSQPAIGGRNKKKGLKGKKSVEDKGGRGNSLGKLLVQPSFDASSSFIGKKRERKGSQKN